MLRIGITGQSGFIGTHLCNYLKLQPGVERINFEDRFFLDKQLLSDWVKKCDVIIHLAAMNRHNDPNSLYETNLHLVQILIDVMEKESVRPHLIFSSSIQEELDNQYGRSKKEGREKFHKWAKNHDALFTGMIIPNVFGPFGNPYYNSVVATFSHQLTHNELPHIENDSDLKLIYIGELVEQIWDIVEKKKISPYLQIKNTWEAKVSEILDCLNNYKVQYLENNVFPNITNNFELNLFNTFRSYINYTEHFPVQLKNNNDSRGRFVETVRASVGGQFSFSTTQPGITRGDHFHTRKIERFAVIGGQAVIEIRRIGTADIVRFELNGEQPAIVDIPVWHTHKITNVGKNELITLFWVNEFYDPLNPDTFYEEVSFRHLEFI